jgi:hypothetical protein
MAVRSRSIVHGERSVRVVIILCNSRKVAMYCTILISSALVDGNPCYVATTLLNNLELVVRSRK